MFRNRNVFWNVFFGNPSDVTLYPPVSIAGRFPERMRLYLSNPCRYPESPRTPDDWRQAGASSVCRCCNGR